MEENLKQLLLKDLCVRLPYGVKVAFYLYVINEWKTTILRSINPSEETYRIGNQDYNDLTRIKPYLRPMSSITEEERETYKTFFNEDGLLNTSIDVYLDWLLEGHFDYRGLIPKGLAIAVTEENNPYKTE